MLAQLLDLLNAHLLPLLIGICVAVVALLALASRRGPQRPGRPAAAQALVVPGNSHRAARPGTGRRGTRAAQPPRRSAGGSHPPAPGGDRLAAAPATPGSAAASAHPAPNTAHPPAATLPPAAGAAAAAAGQDNPGSRGTETGEAGRTDAAQPGTRPPRRQPAERPPAAIARALDPPTEVLPASMLLGPTARGPLSTSSHASSHASPPAPALLHLPLLPDDDEPLISRAMAQQAAEGRQAGTPETIPGAWSDLPEGPAEPGPSSTAAGRPGGTGGSGPAGMPGTLPGPGALPAAAQHAGGRGAAAGTTPGGWPVLLVDDSAVVRAKLCRAFEGAGYRVLQAGHGLEALRLLQRNRCALLVTDLEMPEMDGIALVDALAARPALDGLPVLAITGHDDLHGRLQGRSRIGAVLRKPWNDAELLQHARALMAAPAEPGTLPH